jgi:hypothetical protein
VGTLRRAETLSNRAERIVAEELQRLHCQEDDLSRCAKVALTARLRKETARTVKWIGRRLNLGTAGCANRLLYRVRKKYNMTKSRTVPFMFLVVLISLLLLNLGWMMWSWHMDAGLRGAAKQFKFGYFYTNGVACVGIQDAKTGEPLVVEWDFGDGDKPGEVSYFFHGTNVLDIYIKKGLRTENRFIFHGPGKSEVWWLDRGTGSFTDRISYDTNGNRADFEIWYAGAWHSVDRRNKTNGIIVDARWRQLRFDTNHMWAIKAITNRP